jgi:AmmeMemoRadiSam system protein B
MTVFSRIDEPIPPLRGDIDAIPFRDNGRALLLLRDPAGYSEQLLTFPAEAGMLFSLFDGTRSVAQLCAEFRDATGENVGEETILSIIRTLDECAFLDTEHFRKLRAEKDEDYMRQPLREAVHAGASYPEDPGELRAFFDSLFDADATDVHAGRLAGVLAPHIDLSIGPQVYVPAFRHLATTTADTVVILGTAHSEVDDLFILTEKHFVTPLGTMTTDEAFVRELRERMGDVLTRRDTPFRMEHSIEFPVLFLQHIFGNERVRIVPILLAGFDGLLYSGLRATSSARYTAFLTAFRETVASLGRNVVFVLSVDWSHVGRKFHDQVDAAEVLDAVRASDHEQLAALEAADYERFFSLLEAGRNATHIDGFSCITTFFDLASPRRGALLDYQIWHEEERASAVSFASMAFFHGGDDESPKPCEERL